MQCSSMNDGMENKDLNDYLKSDHASLDLEANVSPTTVTHSRWYKRILNSQSPLFEEESVKASQCSSNKILYYFESRWKICAVATLLGLVLILLAMALCYHFIDDEEWLNVHLIPHTHDDVGWQRTVDQYYSEAVHSILDNVIDQLSLDSSRKFVYVETVYFWKWWQMQNEQNKRRVKQLVEDGQLEFAGGGWSMNDEAVTHYQSIIDQLTWGLRCLNDTFGEPGRPKVGWQIDAFGHSQEMASITARLGFDGLFFARIHEDDREWRLKHQNMEFIWEGSSFLGSTASVFTSVMYQHYSPPDGFHFERYGNEFMDGEEKKKIMKFIRYARNQAKHYKTNNILISMGDDFTYIDARAWFTNMDKIIEYVSQHQKKMNVFYSTPWTYLKSLHESNSTWPVKQNDFLPYASGRHSYWTGYYTSRPTLKYFERVGNNFLQVCKQLYSLANLGTEYIQHLITLREAMGVMQHHDAVTGTAKQHVTNDYVETLFDSINQGKFITREALSKLGGVDIDASFCLLLNSSQCDITESTSSFITIVYNPLGWGVNKLVRLPVTRHMSVVSSSGDTIESQMLSVSDAVLQIPNRNKNVSSELVFLAKEIPPLGFKSYYVSQVGSKVSGAHINVAEEEKSVSDTIKIGNKDLQVTFSRKTGMMTAIVSKGTVIPCEQSLKFYIGDHHWTGAYLFRPVEDMPYSFDNVKIKVINNGPLVEEVEQVFSDWASQVVRVYKDEEFVEIEWLVGPIPVSDYFGKEVVSLFSTKIINKGKFFTDSNARETMERTRNWREGSYINKQDQVPANYFPVTSHISIRDKSFQLFIVNDRAQGGTSARDGDIELMVHRRLCYDDGKGVGEPLNETEYGEGLRVRGKHWVFLADSKDNDVERRVKKFSQQKLLDSWIFLQDAAYADLSSYRHGTAFEFSGLNSTLPPNIHLLTLEPWTDDTLLIRLENTWEPRTVQNDLVQTVKVDLKTLFSTFEVVWARETTLGANQWLSEVKRLNWEAESKECNGIPSHVGTIDDILVENMIVYLSPMSIRTFVIRYLTLFSHYKSDFKCIKENTKIFQSLDVRFLSRVELRTLTGTVTGHCPFRYHLKPLGKVTYYTYRFCSKKSEIARHLLCNCPAVAGRSLVYLETWFLQPEELMKLAPRKIIKFIKNLLLEWELAGRECHNKPF